MAVSFNGSSKLIILGEGTRAITVKEIYSRWKDWVLLSDNAKYLQALSVIGGDPLPGGNYLGSTFFLENGWKIRPQEADHSLTVSGNIYTRDGGAPFVTTTGAYNVLISLTVSNIVDTVSTSGSSSLSGTDISNIAANAAAQVWNKTLDNINTSNSIGVHIKSKVLTKNNFLGLKD